MLDPSTEMVSSRSYKRRSLHAPQHFAFVHAKAELMDPPGLWIWKYRYLTLLVALFFAVKGGQAVLILSRNDWTFPIVNDRSLLIAHWCMGTLFLAGTLWQQLSIPLMAEAGHKWGPLVAAKFRRWHRWIGRITSVASLGAALTAFLLAPRALAGQWIFTTWSICWMIMTVKTWGTALQKQYQSHKLWAEALSRTALAFLYGRVILVAYTYASGFMMTEAEHLRHAERAYQYSMVGTALFTVTLTAHCAHTARLEAQRTEVKGRWRKLRGVAAFLGPAATPDSSIKQECLSAS
jgi:hypothetical protein